MVRAEVLASRNEYAGLSPMRVSHHRYYFLYRLAELQQGLFNVNTCLYYIENNLRGCSADRSSDEITKPKF